MDQKELFLREEGDAYFKRNRHAHASHEGAAMQEDLRYMCHVLDPFRSRIGRILEVGCSNGLKLEALSRNFEASGMGIDPSAMAIEDGKTRPGASHLDLRVGTGDHLPCDSASFDLVYLAFCLYLTDRPLLLKTVAEADRVLKPGGFLAITDFDPGTRYRKPYSHLEGAFSYKQDYTRAFLESGHYYLAGKHSYSHRFPRFDEDADERVATAILYKDPDAYPTWR
jgi:SAM-dependent methyltransferase